MTEAQNMSLRGAQRRSNLNTPERRLLRFARNDMSRLGISDSVSVICHLNLFRISCLFSLQSSQVKSAVDVDDLARAEVEPALGDGADGPADVLG